MRKAVLTLTGIVLFGFSLLAQETNSVILFTNMTASFTNLQGRAYEGVKLKKADLDGLIWTTDSGGGGLISFTNMDPAVLNSLGVPTNRIALAQERIRQRGVAQGRRQYAVRLAAAASAKAAAQEAEAKKIHLVYSFSGYGYDHKIICLIKNSTSEEARVNVYFQFFTGNRISLGNRSESATVEPFGQSAVTEYFWTEAESVTVTAKCDDGRNVFVEYLPKKD